jgi:glycosyltransferase involved in cell wall biosynthesis
MAEEYLNEDRPSVGFLLLGDYGWAGGLYYVLNLIKALGYLEDKQKPRLVVFFNNETPLGLLSEINYPYLQLKNLDDLNLFMKIWFRLLLEITKKNYRLESAINPYQLNILYPATKYHHDLRGINCRILYWIYDFQHKFLPEYFSPQELAKRDKDFQEIVDNASDIVVSSYDSEKHFRQFYPDYNKKLTVLQFVSILNTSNNPPFELLSKKYAVKRPYFLVCNQFWQHKNHKVVFEAIALAKKKAEPVFVVFTGNQSDPRHPGYFEELMKFAKDQGILDMVKFTGFISREEQISLMQHATAVIQPSLFEGWSTVIEDAKTLGSPIIASSISVHLEQLGSDGTYFEPENFEKLLNQMIELMRGIKPPHVLEKGDVRFKRFALKFLQLIEV